MIPEDQYISIIEAIPILCVDVVLSNAAGQYLLIKRANEPLKDQWWVIGGRVLRGETLEEAAIRKVREETNLTIDFMEPIGYYEGVFEKNPFGEITPQHSVSVVFSAVIDDRQKVELDYQSSEWDYFKELPCNFNLKRFANLSNPNVRSTKP